MRLLVAYNGAPFHGVTPQPRHRTVGGDLIDAVTRLLRQPDRVPFTCAGRTDAGVHGWGQVVHVDVVPGTPIDPQGLRRRLNKLLAPELVVRGVHLAEPGFDARHSARWRRYRYTLLVQDDPDPFLAATAWHVAAPLSLEAMRLACDPFLGTHDFTSFCRVPKDQPDPSMVRTLLDARWHDPIGNRWVFEITATSFCQQMVRAIVGYLVDVGRGKRSAGEIRDVIAAQNRAHAAPIAPPHGLVLWEVGYAAPLPW